VTIFVCRSSLPRSALTGDPLKSTIYFLLLSLLFAVGCVPKGPGPEVVAYTALDQEFSAPIYADFEKETGVTVRAKFDIESTKSVGLTAALLAEKDNPRCDVFWNNEVLNTIRLEQAGLLEVYRSPVAENFPSVSKSKSGTWQGFAARARILLINTDLVKEEEFPRSIYDLADEKWKGKAAIAKPLAGTTATHVACLFAHLGPEKAKAYIQSLMDNEVLVLGGNKQVALAVAAGQAAFGLTDTDDAVVEIEKGAPVAIVYPDREEGQLGTLFIPNTIAIIKGGPNTEGAKKLVDYLLSAKVEEKLALGRSAQIPLNPDVKIKTRVETPRTVHAMPADFEAAAQEWEAAQQFVKETIAKE
jgi:iron(III) transport system substrate-binding protein